MDFAERYLDPITVLLGSHTAECWEVWPCTHPSTIYPFSPWSTCPFTQPCIYPSIHPSTHFSIHPSMSSFSYYPPIHLACPLFHSYQLCTFTAGWVLWRTQSVMGRARQCLSSRGTQGLDRDKAPLPRHPSFQHSYSTAPSLCLVKMCWSPINLQPSFRDSGYVGFGSVFSKQILISQFFQAYFNGQKS